MDLTIEQRQAVKRWVDEGTGLSQVQTRIKAEFGVSLTFLATRMLVQELGAQVKDKPEPKKPAPPPSAVPPGGEDSDDMEEDPAAAGAPDGLIGGKVSVSLDRVVRAGAVAIVLHPLGDTSDPLARAMACLADRGRWTLWTWLVRNAGLVRDARFGAPELARIADRLDTTPERLAACLADPGTDGVVRAAREAAAFGTLPHYRVDGVDLPAGAGLADVLAALRGDETDQ